MFRGSRLIVAFFCLTASLLTSLPAGQAAESDDGQFDVIIYGGTSGAVTAAVQVRKMGRSVAIVCPDKHLGGLSSGGLGWTDTGNKAVIGGLAREFYHRVWNHYQTTDAWRWQERQTYGNKGQGAAAIDGEQRTMWIFEPHVAEKAFEEFITEYDIPVFRNEWLNRDGGVSKSNGRITSIRMLSGKSFRAGMFIDATYEGDLLATAGVTYHVGREAKSQYGEDWNGIQTGVLHHGHHFGVLKTKISPYVVPDDPSSGLLPRISPDDPGDYGAADHRVQAYCFRMCLTNHDDNRVPFTKPAGYDAKQYELLARVFEAGWREHFSKFDPIPNYKTDTNNHGPFSTDNIGFNYDYPDASYERRKEIISEHEEYQRGLMYFIANDPRVPSDVRTAMSKWGLAADEFTDNDNWPHQIYVREARRMVGQYVMTENELLKRRPTPQSIGMGSYTMDSHNVQRYVTPEGYVQNEGDIGVSTRGPYEIAFGSILPKQEQCENLLVPVCLSSSHIAFGSIRMEPVFMILGQSAATTAVMALDGQLPVQDVKYEALRERLLKDGQILETPPGTAISRGGHGVDARSLDGVVIDESEVKLSGNWSSSASTGSWVGNGYRHDADKRDGKASARFEADLKKSGKYEVRISYSANPNRATNVPVVVQHAAGESAVKIDQKQAPKIDGLFTSVGAFEFSSDKTAVVVISNEGANGYVIVDAVQWLFQE